MINKYFSKKYVQELLWILILIILWEFICKLNIYPIQSFPSVESIIIALWNGLIKGELLKQIIFSIIIILKGLTIAVFIALVMSYLSYRFSIIDSLVEALVLIAHPLPGIALLPIVILCMGIGEKAVLFIIIHSVLWPMILNIKMGFNSVPKIYTEIGKNYQLGHFKLFIHILLPASFAYFISGLKIGWSRSWRALISSEMVFGAIGSFGGVGWYIFEKRTFMDTAGMYAGLVVIVLIGILVEALFFNNIEKATIKKWGMIN